jgi:PAS domain S-box-containing protein
MKRYYKKEPYIALALALPYTVIVNNILFGSCLFSNPLTFLILTASTVVYMFISYLVFGLIALGVRNLIPSDADLFKRIALLLGVFYMLNAISAKILLLLYSKFPNAGCPVLTESWGWTVLIGCLMSTIITIVNEGVANWEKWKQAIAETETFRTLSLIARETNNAVALLDLEGRITWINQAFTHLSGYSEAEALHQPFFDLLQCRPSDAAQAISLTNLFDAASVEKEMDCINKDGEQRWLQSSIHLMPEKKNSPQRFFIISTDITERKKLEAELLQQQKKTTAAILAVQEKERAIIGQELHDNVNQVLTTIKLYNEICLDDVAKNQALLQKSVQLLQTTINEIRSLSKRLSAPSLGKMKLSESVKELMESLAATGRMAISLDLSGIEELDVNHELHITIYRIIQEQLTNIIKHAEASDVKVVIDFMDHHLYLSVVDNGKGFSLYEQKGGMGITNMITRAESLHGTICIDTAPGKGCTLEVRLPLL